MIEINIANIDWLLVRQALSLALLKNKPVTIRRGAPFLNEHPEYKPLFNDLARISAAAGTGRLACDNESIVFDPRPIASGTYDLESAASSSTVELLLFLMPALLYGNFRTIINLRGVTHSVLSYPTSFIKESLLKAMEGLGFYASCSLKRFGFQGTGGGTMESRIYPHEAKKTRILGGKTCAVTGITIFISHANTDIAMQEKQTLARLLELDENKIGIIEVIDSDGTGNSIQVHVNYGGINLVLFREVLLNNGREEINPDEKNLAAVLSGLSGEARTLTRDRVPPDYLVRELYPYVLLSGSEFDAASNNPPVALTRDVCVKMLQ